MMKRITQAVLLAVIAVVSMLAVGCSRETQEGISNGFPKPEVFHAVMDGRSDTKVYSDPSLSQFWNAGDLISVFNRFTLNQKYAFNGSNGAAEGDFLIVSDQDTGSGTVLPSVYAVYPFREGNAISSDGVITTELPAVQVYREGTYPLEAHTMAAVTTGTELTFKNATGFVVVRVTGSGNAVTEITLTSKGGEFLSGPATVTVREDGAPDLVMSEGGSASVKLTCNPAVTLGEVPVEFWIALPPTKMSQGFTLHVQGDDLGEIEVGTDKEFTVRRNAVKRISAIALPSNTGYPDPRIDALSYAGDNPSRLEMDGEDDSVFILTVPTVTDFSALDMSIVLPAGMSAVIGGEEVTTGPVTVNATSGSAPIIVRSGDKTKEYTLRVRNTGLPVVRLNTSSRVEPKDRTTWLEGSTLRIEKADGTVDYEGSLAVRGRGNGTWAMPKRPYALKLDKKSMILGMPKHKRWVLLANWGDRTLLRNVAAFWLSNQTESLLWAPRGRFVELVLNGEYRGNYYLCEQIKIDENRINIPEMDDFEEDPAAIEAGGFHLEIDPYDQGNRSWSNEYGRYYSWSEETPKFITDRFHLPISFKEPDEDVISSAQFNYMKDFINRIEDKLYTPFSSEVVFTFERLETDGTEAGAIDTGIKLFDGSFPNGFRITFDLDLSENELTYASQRTFLSCMSEAGSPYPGLTLRHTNSVGKGEVILNEGVKGTFNLSASNHVVISCFNGSVFVDIGSWSTGGTVTNTEHDYPLTIGGTRGDTPDTWKQGRFAACTIRNLTIEKVLSSECEWMDMLDSETFIDYVLVQELTGNRDFWQSGPAFGPEKGNYPYSKAPHSMHIYKDGPLLKAGPVWDFDYRTFTQYTQGRWIGLDKNPWYTSALAVSAFSSRLVEKWDDTKQAFLGLGDFLDGEAARLSLSESFNHEMWPIESTNYFHVEGTDNGDETLGYMEAIALMKEQFQLKWNYIDSHIRKVK